MSFLHHSTRSSFLSLPLTFTRHLTDVSRKQISSRVIVIKNFPPTAPINDFLLSLHGPSHPIESSAKLVLEMANQKQLKAAGQQLEVKLLDVEPPTLSVELVAYIGLRGASRTLLVNIPRSDLSEDDLRMTMESYGPVESVNRGKVVFSHIWSAMRAKRSLKAKGWEVTYVESLPVEPEGKQSGKPKERLYQMNLRIRHRLPWKFLRDLDSKITFDNGDPLRFNLFNRTGKGFLSFASSDNARRFYNDRIFPYTTWDTSPTNMKPIAAALLGASRIVHIQGFKDKRISPTRMYRDFSPFGSIYYIYFDAEKAIGRVVFTDAVAALKVIEQMYHHRSQFCRYYGARVTFGYDYKPKPDNVQDSDSTTTPYLRPLLIPDVFDPTWAARAEDSTLEQEFTRVLDTTPSVLRVSEDQLLDWEDLVIDVRTARWKQVFDRKIGGDRLEVQPPKTS
ncbi:hypothetical protein D9758_009207 [Tetrapyrgos nigripes]|uniref:RRM domain-containing protein n=1 Tax=Tetrapyrgos nigripes TaxID=182062 RepID=A0A8H5D2U1_9AGAR|nr:hypothetical protein D9758_009207 [Tetrapyrgos nigripes]